MAGWRDSLTSLQAQALRLPKIFWAVGGVIAVSLATVAWLETAGPPYAR